MSKYTKPITKKEFIKYMDTLKKLQDKLNTLPSDFAHGVIEFFTLDLVITLLEKEFGLEEDETGYTLLSWWVYETKFGEVTRAIKISGNKYVIKSAGELWDFIMKNKQDREVGLVDRVRLLEAEVSELKKDIVWLRNTCHPWYNQNPFPWLDGVKGLDVIKGSWTINEKEEK